MSIGDGQIKLKFGYGPFKRSVTIFGGPIQNAPSFNLHRLNLRAEAPDLPAEQQLLIVDFEVPTMSQARAGVETFLERSIEDGASYVGCMGGIGRTGLIMALCAKVAGEKAPILKVRADYKPHAVETQEQKRLVADFIPGPMAGRLNRRAALRTLKFWR